MNIYSESKEKDFCRSTSEARWTRGLARGASLQDALSCLRISAAIVDVGIGKGSSPHHDATKGAVGVVLARERGQGAGLEVVLGAALGAGGAHGRRRHADEDLGVSRGRVGDVLLPLVKVDGAVERAAGVVVELNKEVVELGSSDDLVHVGLRDGALRSAGDVVGVGRVRGKVGSKLGDHVLVVLVSTVGLNVKVPAVDKGLAERSRHLATSTVSVGIPQILTDGLGLGLRGQSVRSRGAAERQDDLDAVGLAGVDGLGKAIASLALSGGGDGARLSDGAARDSDAVAVLVEERQHNDVDSRAGRAVGGQVVVLKDVATVLAPVDDVLAASRPARHSLGGSSQSGRGHEAEAGERSESGIHVDVEGTFVQEVV